CAARAASSRRIPPGGRESAARRPRSRCPAAAARPGPARAGPASTTATAWRQAGGDGASADSVVCRQHTRGAERRVNRGLTRVGAPVRRPFTPGRYHSHFDLAVLPEFHVSNQNPPIRIYSTAICPYCVAAKNFLKSQGRERTELRVHLDPADRRNMSD